MTLWQAQKERKLTSVGQGSLQSSRETIEPTSIVGKSTKDGRSFLLLLASIRGHPEASEGNFVSDTSHLCYSVYCDKSLPPSSVLLIPPPYLSTKLGFIWNGLPPPIHFHTRPRCHAAGGEQHFITGQFLRSKE